MLTLEQAIDLIRDAMFVSLVIIGPILVIGMVVGLVISLVQAVTQIQEQTLAFVPKIFAMAIAIVFVMPWMFQRLIEYSRHLFTMGGG
ncbi:MAG TPA: flagellar biosynthesis protein FliQ [Phycisphaerae bacterium]|jgi:flagellar biosynthetic protein FliQ|nr:flagellar biosynthesis protein FliQ [Phycisphaerae bacterium]